MVNGKIAFNIKITNFKTNSLFPDIIYKMFYSRYYIVHPYLLTSYKPPQTKPISPRRGPLTAGRTATTAHC